MSYQSSFLINVPIDDAGQVPLNSQFFLFCDTVSGAHASANLYSLIETSMANGKEPYAYLRRVFAELPGAITVEEIEALLPCYVDPE